MASERDGTTPHWWDEAAAAFDAWLARQSDEVREMTLLEQIEIYGQENQHVAK